MSHENPLIFTFTPSRCSVFTLLMKLLKKYFIYGEGDRHAILIKEKHIKRNLHFFNHSFKEVKSSYQTTTLLELL